MTHPLDKLVQESGITDPESLALLREELEARMTGSIQDAVAAGIQHQSAKHKAAKTKERVDGLDAELAGLSQSGKLSNHKDNLRRKEILDELKQLDSDHSVTG